MTDRRFPNLFLAGAPKCGTTSLADWLARHPDIFMPALKEPVFFANDLTAENPRMSEESYLDLYRKWAREARAIDASTHNFFSGTAAGRIAEKSPDARIVLMLRDPAEACHSLFHQLRFNGSEELDDFEASLAAEEDRARHLTPLRRGFPETLLYTRVYDFRGNIGRYLEHFGRDRIRVLLLDDLRTDPKAEFRSLLEWLSLDPGLAETMDYRTRNSAKRMRWRFLNDLAVYPPKWAAIARPFLPRGARLRLRDAIGRVNTVAQPNPPLDPGLRQMLVERFAPQVAWLEEFLQRDLSHWRV